MVLGSGAGRVDKPGCWGLSNVYGSGGLVVTAQPRGGGFSSFQGRFRSHMRSATPRMQVRELALMSICHNHIH